MDACVDINACIACGIVRNMDIGEWLLLWRAAFLSVYLSLHVSVCTDYMLKYIWSLCASSSSSALLAVL